MRAHDFIGRYNMYANVVEHLRCVANQPLAIVCLASLVALMWSTPLLADEFPADAVELDAESGQRIEEPGGRRDWRLDPAVFTDIYQVTTTEVAIKLPEDQREDD